MNTSIGKAFGLNRCSLWTELLRIIGACCIIWVPFVQARGQDLSTTASPPRVTITHPRAGSVYVWDMMLQVSAKVTLAPEEVREMRFSIQDAVIDVVPVPPYMSWVSLESAVQPGYVILTATVVGTNGVSVVSDPVRIAVLQAPPPFYEYEVASPADGDIILSSQPFEFSADTLATPRGSGPHLVELLVGTNSVATFAAPPYLTTVKNLPKGMYELTVDDRSTSSKVTPIHIRVADLGIRTSSLEGTAFAFDVVTAFPGKQTTIQTSPDLRKWTSISTNVPSGNLFHFVDPNLPPSSARFYRVVVPP